MLARWLCFALFFFCLLDSPSLLAQRDGGPTEEEVRDAQAREHFRVGNEYFSSGDYEAALEEFREAYELSNRPALIYNIATTLDRLRRDQETVDALKRYLKAVPNAPQRTEVSQRIALLEARIAQRKEEERKRRELEELSEKNQQSHGLHPAFFVTTAGLALATLGVAFVAAAETTARNDDYVSYTEGPLALRPVAQAKYDNAYEMQLITNTLFFSSLGLGVLAGVFLIFTDWGVEDAETQIQPTVAFDSNGFTLGLRGRI